MLSNMITPHGHIKLLLQDNVLNALRTKTPIACVAKKNSKDFLKKSYPHSIHNECTMTKGRDRLRWEEVQT
jgi:hypothetical protein